MNYRLAFTQFKDHSEITVRGVYYRMENAKFARLNSPVRLVPEPNNQYDSNAIKVECPNPDSFNDSEYFHIGYIPREITKEIYDILQSDEKYLFFISKLNSELTGVTISISAVNPKGKFLKLDILN